MASLRYLDDDGRISIKSLDTEHFIIGRAGSSNLIFDSDMISREHVRIDLVKEGRFRIRDLGSRNKTFVNGELITETLLNPGDIIRAGDRVIEFTDDSVTTDRLDLDFLTPDRVEPPHCEWIKLKTPLALTVAQLERLAALGSDLPMTARAEDIASAALGQVILELEAERGFIALRGERKSELRTIAHRAMARAASTSRVPVSQSFALAPLLQGVAGRYPLTTGQLNSKLGYAVTAAVAPLTYRGDAVGVLYVDRPASRKPFPAGALQFVLAAGAHTGALLGDSISRMTSYVPREALAWLATIRKMHSALTIALPAGDTFATAVERIPGRARCGDFAHVINIDEHRCVAFVVDGGGHGVSGLAQAHAMQSAVRAALAVDDAAAMDPGALFNALNLMIARSAGRQVLPCLYVALDIATGKAAYINAGGPPPLLMVAPGRLITLDQMSLVLGVDEDYLYEPTRVELPESFRLICLTDGVAEAANAGGEAFGDQRLHEALLERSAFGSAAQVISTVTKAWRAHLAGTSPDDDALLLALARG